MGNSEHADKDRDRIAIPLDPKEALRALLKVDPDSEPISDEGKTPARQTPRIDSPGGDDE